MTQTYTLQARILSFLSSRQGPFLVQEIANGILWGEGEDTVYAKDLVRMELGKLRRMKVVTCSSGMVNLAGKLQKRTLWNLYPQKNPSR
jgi:hypothetical protein